MISVCARYRSTTEVSLSCDFAQVREHVTSECGQRLPAAGGFSGIGGTAGASVSDMRRMMTARTHGVHGIAEKIVTTTEGGPMADEHTFALTIEASGEVTPAAHPAPADTDEAAPLNDEEEPTDG